MSTPTVKITPEQAAAQAELALTRTLWQEKVVEATGILNKISGFFSYVYAYTVDAKASVEKDAAAKELSKTISKLGFALAKRALTQVEGNKLGMAAVQFNSAMPQQVNAGFELQAQDAEEAFYKAFKNRVAQMKISTNSDAFGVHAIAAKNLIANSVNNVNTKKIFGDAELTDASKAAILRTNKVKVASAQEAFNGRIFTDMVDSYAKLPLADMTIQGYKDTVATIKKFFSTNSEENIEAAIRMAIKANNPSLTSFTDLRAAYLDTTAGAEKFGAIRKAKEEVLTAEQKTLHERQAALQGPNNFDGLLNEKYQAKAKAEAELNAAVEAFKTLLNGAFGNVNTLSADQLIALAVTDARFAPAQAEIVAKKAALEAASKEFADLDAEYATIAWSRNGRLVAVDQEIRGLDTYARNEANKLGAFIGELSRPIGSATANVAYTRMHAII